MLNTLLRTAVNITFRQWPIATFAFIFIVIPADNPVYPLFRLKSIFPHTN
jgi:hypothetical protein